MEKITALLENLDFAKYLPAIDKLMGWIDKLITLSIRIGPLCILGLGLIYLLIPPKEANHKAGFRTYFGMGSIAAWLFIIMIMKQKEDILLIMMIIKISVNTIMIVVSKH